MFKKLLTILMVFGLLVVYGDTTTPFVTQITSGS